MKAAYIGFGVLGKQIQSFINEFEKPEQSVFFDDLLHEQKAPNSFPFQHYMNAEFSDFAFYVCLGYRHLPLKNKISKELIKSGRNLPSFIHPSVYIAPSSTVEKGCILYPKSTIDMEVKIEQGALLNNSVIVSHNSIIGSCCYLSPGIIISGNVQVGENSFLGSGTIVSNNISIGSNSVIGVGSVLTRSIPENTNGIGSPFRILNHPLKL